MSRLLDQPAGGQTYAAAGVDIAAGDEAVERIKSVVASTNRPGVMGSIGGFGGAFNLGATGLTKPNPCSCSTSSRWAAWSPPV
ncbi:MAG: hypothetical protein WCG62_06720 [Actinomycetes bacterium]